MTILIMSLIKKVIKKAIKVFTGCEFLYKTNWYKSMFRDINHEIYPDNVWYREHDERNFDVVNLGSSGGKWSFDYTDLNIKAMNWAQQPQSLLEDYNLLRHFHSILKQGGCVLITIMPFTSLNKKTGLMDAMKYVKFDIQGEPIQPYMFKEAQRYANYPILFKKVAIKALIKYFFCRDGKIDVRPNTQLDYNPMNSQDLDADAKIWIDGWKRQFGIADFDAPLTEENQKGREYRIKLMQTLIDFCTERGYKPVFIIPPVTEHLAKYYTPKFEETYIYGYLKSIGRKVLTLDYSKNPEFRNDDSLYFNSFFLNKRGRKLFTRRVLKDLGFENKE